MHESKIEELMPICQLQSLKLHNCHLSPAVQRAWAVECGCTWGKTVAHRTPLQYSTSAVQRSDSNRETVNLSSIINTLRHLQDIKIFLKFISYSYNVVSFSNPGFLSHSSFLNLQIPRVLLQLSSPDWLFIFALKKPDW